LLNADPGLAADKLKVLIIDGQNNHDWRSATPVLKELLEVSRRFTVEVSTSPDKNADASAWDAWRPAFSDYDAVLSNYNGQSWPEPVKEAFEAYVRDGGGLVIIHAANNAFGKWEAYNRMIAIGGWGGRNEKSGPYLYYDPDRGKVVRDNSPGRGGSHGAQHEFIVEIRDPDHPVTRGMPSAWKHTKDELYDSLRGPAENVKVLATAYSPKSKRHEPMMLAVTFGRGRVFHTPMGHADYSMRCQGFYDTVQRGTEWAATGAVSLPLSDRFPSRNASSPVPAP
jgi:type 1 glutamine amidotransferase